MSGALLFRRRALVLLIKSMFPLSHYDIFLHELMNQYQACLYLFEWIFHGDSKYGHEIPKWWYFFKKLGNVWPVVCACVPYDHDFAGCNGKRCKVTKFWFGRPKQILITRMYQTLLRLKFYPCCLHHIASHLRYTVQHVLVYVFWKTQMSWSLYTVQHFLFLSNSIITEHL